MSEQEPIPTQDEVRDAMGMLEDDLRASEIAQLLAYKRHAIALEAKLALLEAAPKGERERERFEKWFEKEYEFENRHPDGAWGTSMWEAWQAALSGQGRER